LGIDLVEMEANDQGTAPGGGLVALVAAAGARDGGAKMTCLIARNLSANFVGSAIFGSADILTHNTCEIQRVRTKI
jgi:hypothetical protein